MVVTDTFNPSTKETEIGKSVWIWDMPVLQRNFRTSRGIHKETLSQKCQTIKEKNKLTNKNQSMIRQFEDGLTPCAGYIPNLVSNTNPSDIVLTLPSFLY